MTEWIYRQESDGSKYRVRELVRCDNCEYAIAALTGRGKFTCVKHRKKTDEAWFCADGRPKEKTNEFVIGDEVRYINNPSSVFVITYIDNDGFIGGIGMDGDPFINQNPQRWEKTGRHFPEVKALMDAMTI